MENRGQSAHPAGQRGSPRFVGLSKVFQPIGNHSGHACFLNLSVGSVNEVGLFDTRFEFEANTDGA